ncbi:hypothetical protein HPB47_018995, partial [Ixodes persulcatus]
PAEVLTCKKQTCGKELTDTGKRLIRCQSCSTVTCRDCKAAHENMTCKAYREGKNEKPSTVSRGQNDKPGFDSADSKRYEAHSVEVFIPGEEYVCGARLQAFNDYCCFSVVLHEGSQRFWCPWCLAKHSIVTDQRGK